MKRPSALVTGATSGIGEVFATFLAKQGYDLVIVARDETRLNQRASQWHSHHGVDVEILRADLSNHQDISKVAARLSDQNRPIDVLINNAGFGINKGFSSSTSQEEQALLDEIGRAHV